MVSILNYLKSKFLNEENSFILCIRLYWLFLGVGLLVCIFFQAKKEILVYSVGILSSLAIFRFYNYNQYLAKWFFITLCHLTIFFSDGGIINNSYTCFYYLIPFTGHLFFFDFQFQKKEIAIASLIPLALLLITNFVYTPNITFHKSVLFKVCDFIGIILTLSLINFYIFKKYLLREIKDKNIRKGLLAAFYQSNQIIFTLDKEILLTSYNSNFVEYIKKINENFIPYIGFPILKIVPNEIFRKRLFEEFQRVLQNEIVENGFKIDTTPMPTYIQYKMFPVLDINDEIVGIRVFSTDITNERLLQKKINDQRKLYESILINIPAELTCANEKAEFFLLNKKAQKTPEGRKKYIGKTHLDFISAYKLPSELFQKRYENYLKAIETKQEQIIEESIVSSVTGRTHYHIRHFTPILDDNGKFLCAIEFGKEVTEIKEAEIKEERLVSFYEQLFMNTPIGVSVFDKHARFVFVNNYAISDPTRREYSKGKTLIEYGAVSTQPMSLMQDRHAQILEVIESKTSVKFDVEYIFNSHGEKEFFFRSIAPIFNHLQEIEYVLITNLNITNLETTKLLLEKSLEENKKLLSTISHELRTPIHALGMLTEIILNKTLDAETASEVIQIKSTVSKMEKIVNSILEVEIEQEITEDVELLKSRLKSVGQKNILLAEDNRLNVVVFKKALKDFDFNIDVCDNGAEAVRLSKENKYDIIVMDLQMPIMEGTEACQLIKTDEHNINKNTPMLSFTADVISFQASELKKLGFNASIFKPINLSNLYNVLLPQFQVKN